MFVLCLLLLFSNDEETIIWKDNRHIISEILSINSLFTVSARFIDDTSRSKLDINFHFNISDSIAL